MPNLACGKFYSRANFISGKCAKFDFWEARLNIVQPRFAEIKFTRKFHFWEVRLDIAQPRLQQTLFTYEFDFRSVDKKGEANCNAKCKVTVVRRQVLTAELLFCEFTAPNPSQPFRGLIFLHQKMI